ncbi:hypothetical protein LINPERHAP1_LOCUS9255 [Linum perenne]
MWLDGLRLSTKKNLSRRFSHGLLLKLPIHYFNNLSVTRIRNHIGKTVRLDLATLEGDKARYSRACVEVDLSKPLMGKYMIEDRTYFIEYQRLDDICFTCGFYEHWVMLARLIHPSRLMWNK